MLNSTVSPRVAGKGKYNRYLGSLKIGLNGLVGFSSFLLSFTLFLGLMIATVTFLAILVIGISKMFLGISYPAGLTTIIILVLFMDGIQMIGIGILGEYIGRIYDETKKQPRFIVQKTKNINRLLNDGGR